MVNDVTWDLVARDRYGKTYDNAAKKSETLGAKLKKLAVIGAAAGAVLAVKFGADSVRAFADAEKAQTRLSDAFVRFPKLADTSIGALRSLNETLAQKTRFDDDALASGQAVLAQFGLTGKQLQNMTPLLADYAAKTGKDLPTAATTLGKAFLGNTRALKELGISYKPTGDAARDMAVIQELVNQKVGGFAEKEGKTAAGQAEILKNQFGELQEEVGSKLVPILTKLLEIGLKVVDWIKQNITWLGPLVAGIGALVAIIKIWTIAQAALNLVMALNPIGLVIVAIAALVAAFVVAWKKSETFRNVIKAVWQGIKTAFIEGVRAVANFMFKFAEVVLDGAEAAFGWIPGIGDKLRTAQSKLKDFKDNVNKTLDKIRDEEIKIKITPEGLKRVGASAAASAAARFQGVPGGGRGGREASGGGMDIRTSGLNAGRIGNIATDYRERAGDIMWQALKKGFKATDIFGAPGPGARALGSSGRFFPLPPGTYSWGQGPGGHGYDAQDLPVPTGTSVFAPISGFAQGIDLGNRSYGKYVKITSSRFGRVILAHLSKLFIGAGNVNAGQRVGLSGSTGNSTGPHLHVEPSSILSFAKGGIIPEHVIGIGTRSGQPYQFGEGGPETVTPGVNSGNGRTWARELVREMRAQGMVLIATDGARRADLLSRAG